MNNIAQDSPLPLITAVNTENSINMRPFANSAKEGSM